MRDQISIRSNPGEYLSHEAIRRVAPSVFAEVAHASRSQRFTPVPTIQVLTALQSAGFMPVMAATSRVRDSSRREFTRHMLRLRPLSEARAVGDIFPEVVIVNANDGSAAYDMLAGLFRLACLNGAVVSQGTVESVHVRHTGDIIGRIIEGAHTVVREFPRVISRVGEFQALTLNDGERLAYAESALQLKYDDKAPIRADQLLDVRRAADTGSDLWSTYNVVQENMLRGGTPGRSASGRRTRTREVTGITQNVGLNRALWALTEKMAALKAA